MSTKGIHNARSLCGWDAPDICSCRHIRPFSYSASAAGYRISGYQKGQMSGQICSYQLFKNQAKNILILENANVQFFTVLIYVVLRTKNEFVKCVKMSLKRQKNSRISGIRPHQWSGIQKNQYPVHSSACIITRIKLTERAACPGGHLSAGEGSCHSTLHQCTITILP